jgi:hypothetical protein
MVSGPEGLESDVHMQPLVPRRLGIADDSQLIEKTSQLARRLADVREVCAGLRIEVPQRGARTCRKAGELRRSLDLRGAWAGARTPGD